MNFEVYGLGGELMIRLKLAWFTQDAINRMHNKEHSSHITSYENRTPVVRYITENVKLIPKGMNPVSEVKGHHFRLHE